MSVVYSVASTRADMRLPSRDCRPGTGRPGTDVHTARDCRPGTDGTAESTSPSRVDEPTRQGPASHAEPEGDAGTSQDDSAEVSQADRLPTSRMKGAHDPTLMQLTIHLLKWCDRKAIRHGATPSTRSAQRPGGCTVQDQPDSQHRVDVGHGMSTTSVYQVGQTADRHVCYICQQTSDQVCIAISGPQGRVDRRDVHYLGQREGPPVCVLAIQVGPSGAAEDLPVSGSANESGSSQARNSFLVSGASGTVGRKTHPAVRQRSAPALPRHHSTQGRGRDTSLVPAIKSTCMYTLRTILRAKGH